MNPVPVERSGFKDLSKQHLKALIDLRTEELRRLESEATALRRELDDLYLQYSERMYGFK